MVHYHLARLLGGGDTGAALGHQEQHLRVMLRYDKMPLAARSLVDICELLLQRGEDALSARLAQAERLIGAQRNHAQLARLRLVQAAVVREAAPPAGAEEEEALGLWLRQALAAAAEPPGVALGTTRAGVSQLLDQLGHGGRGALAERLRAELTAVPRPGDPIWLPFSAWQAEASPWLKQRPPPCPLQQHHFGAFAPLEARSRVARALQFARSSTRREPPRRRQGQMI